MSFINQQILSAVKRPSGGGGGSVPALPTLTSSGQTLRFRLYADAPTGHLYQDDALTSQAAVGNTVLAIKDLSPSTNNFASTAGGFGSVLTASAVNAKKGLAFVDTATFLENDTSGQVDLFRSASDVTLFCVFYLGAIPGAAEMIKMGVQSSSGAENCLIIRSGAAGGSLYGGRFGADGGASFPLTMYSTSFNASWPDFQNKIFKVVLRAKTGLGNVQRMNLEVSDGTTSVPGSATYTNLSTDVDSASTAWNFAALGGFYYQGTRFPTMNGYHCEAAFWTGTSQMNDTDTAALLSYGAGTAGF